VILHADHIVPVAEGGTSDMHNLVTACQDCNLGKGARLLGSTPDSKAFDVEEQTERISQMKAFSQAQIDMVDEIERQLEAAKEYWWRLTNGSATPDLRSVRMFIKSIGLVEVMDAMDRAVVKTGGDWRYFYATCHHKLRDKKEALNVVVPTVPTRPYYNDSDF